VVFALGADGVRKQRWSAKECSLEFSLKGPEGADVEMAVFSPERPRALTCGEARVPFTYTGSQKLVRASATLDRAQPFRLTY
jgi:hypothetical protein